MCKRPFNRNGNLTTCMYKVSVYAFIQKINSNCVLKSILVETDTNL